MAALDTRLRDEFTKIVDRLREESSSREAADRDATAAMLAKGLDRLRNLLEDAGRG